MAKTPWTPRAAPRKVFLHRVAQDALGQAPVEAREAVRGAVVDAEDEAEVDGVPQAPGVVEEGLADRRLVAARSFGLF
jgi:hypothetical protein